MAYSHELIGNIGVNDESNGRGPINVGVGVDSLGRCTITFGTSYALRIPVEDVDQLRDILYEASRKLDILRYDREMEAAMERVATVRVKQESA